MTGPATTATEVERLKTLLNNNPDDVATVVHLANLYYDLGDAAQAIIYYSYALRIDANQPGAWTDMGTMYWQNGNLSFAERAYRHAIAINPAFGNAYLNLGLLLRDARRNPSQASALWKELVERQPQHPAAQRARSLLAETFLQLG
jgi:tetratricopeptide (TPR) repeat protein